MRERFQYFQDPGHGWVAVHMDELRELGIHDCISNYSYRQGNVAYLEEDQDANEFISRYEYVFKRMPLLETINQEQTHIRGLEPYWYED